MEEEAPGSNMAEAEAEFASLNWRRWRSSRPSWIPSGMRPRWRPTVGSSKRQAEADVLSDELMARSGAVGGAGEGGAAAGNGHERAKSNASARSATTATRGEAYYLWIIEKTPNPMQGEHVPSSQTQSGYHPC